MKIFIVLVIGLLTSAIVKAQAQNTGEPFIKQLKNGTVPGWKFAKNVPAAKTEAITAPATPARSGPLASEQQVKKEPVKKVPLIEVPTQVETKNETPANKQ